jgi:hypothetical protein
MAAAVAAAEVWVISSICSVDAEVVDNRENRDQRKESLSSTLLRSPLKKFTMENPLKLL